MNASGADRLEQQLVALKQLTPAASRLLLRCVLLCGILLSNPFAFSYLIFGKPLAIAAASRLHGADAAAVHGMFLIARNGADLLQEKNYRWFSSLVNNILLLLVGVTTKWLRHVFEVRACRRARWPSVLERWMQGIGRKLASRIETQQPGVLQLMYAVAAAHSVETSEAEYALDADAFKGIVTHHTPHVSRITHPASHASHITYHAPHVSTTHRNPNISASTLAHLTPLPRLIHC